MGLGLSLCIGLVGLSGHLIEVQADVASGLPAFTLVGLPDTALVEARDRVRAAMANAGCALPARKVTVNLSPAALPKSGTAFDLAIATALLAASGQIESGSSGNRVHLGELGLDGRVQPVRGVLPAVLAAVRSGHPRVVVPAANETEARLVPRADVLAVGHLGEVVQLLRDGRITEPVIPRSIDPHTGPEPPRAPDAPDRSGCSWHTDGPRGQGAGPGLGGTQQPDLCEVAGQQEARQAVEVAAAGGHHLLFLGPPGAGKTMLATRMPGLLPDLDDDQALEVTALHSVAGTLDPAGGLVRRPPFESPHHTATVTALVGGGTGLPRPGAASLAHRGVLFLDEAAEFRPQALDSLRQPLERGELVIHRSRGTARFPARFMLVLACNPCPCGQSSERGDRCTCTPQARRRYLSRLSGPLLDRVDLQVRVTAVSRADLAGDPPESSAPVACRVALARRVQRERFSSRSWICNGEVSGTWLRSQGRLPGAVTADLDRALDRGRLSIRGYDRVLRVSWTVADLAGHRRPERDDVGQALALRQNLAGDA
jgi:magnesium chelatase family protein